MRRNVWIPCGCMKTALTRLLTWCKKSYLGKSLAEIADAQQQEKVERTDWKKQELQAQLDLMSDIQAIADRSERTTPDRSNIQQADTAKPQYSPQTRKAYR